MNDACIIFVVLTRGRPKVAKPSLLKEPMLAHR
jgi:hypothetical protein